MYKREIIHVNISSTFIIKSYCKECGKCPTYYYRLANPIKWKDVREYIKSSEVSKRWSSSWLSSWYLEFEPRYFTSLESFVADKAYLPTLHRTRGSKLKLHENVTEFITCRCGATVWAFNNKSVKKRPEIINRMGRYEYPQKFLH